MSTEQETKETFDLMETKRGKLCKDCYIRYYTKQPASMETLFENMDHFDEHKLDEKGQCEDHHQGTF